MTRLHAGRWPWAWELAIVACLLLLCRIPHVEASVGQHNVAGRREMLQQKKLQQPLVDPVVKTEDGHDVAVEKMRPNIKVEIISGSAEYDAAVAILRKDSSRLAPFIPHPNAGSMIDVAARRLFNYLLGRSPSTSKTRSRSRNGFGPEELSKAKVLLETAASLNHPDAIYTLADMHFWGNHSCVRNLGVAFKHYHHLAELTGNSTSQFMVGFMHATGLADRNKTDQAKALLYYSLAAEGGNLRAQMALAYRHYNGVGTARSCEKAIYYSQAAATQVMEFSRRSALGGPTWSQTMFPFSDDQGGLYGEVASTPEPNHVQRGYQVLNLNSRKGLDDMVEYLRILSESNDNKALLMLGKFYYEGSRALKPNHKLAYNNLAKLSNRLWDEAGKKQGRVDSDSNAIAAETAGILGMMYMRGEAVAQSNGRAIAWFRRGVDEGDARSVYGLGLLHLHGQGVQKDVMRAAWRFSKAADLYFPPAQVEMGRLFLDQGEPVTALQYFDLAARSGNPDAFFYLAEMVRLGIGRDKNCVAAAYYYKTMTEKAEMVSANFDESDRAYAVKDYDAVLLRQLMAAEQGFRTSQLNVGFLLDPTKSPWSVFALTDRLLDRWNVSAPSLASAFDFTPRVSDDLNLPGLSLVYYSRAALQSHVDSMVKMGDFYLDMQLSDRNDGKLAPLGAFASDPEMAIAWYQSAGETLRSAQAIWNLGLMHEKGDYMPRSLHLAKRCFDQALEINPRANLPIKPALWRLRMRAYWNEVWGVSNDDGATNRKPSKPATDSQSVPAKSGSLTDWISRFLSNAATAEEHHQHQHQQPPAHHHQQQLATEPDDPTAARAGDRWRYDSDGRPVVMGEDEYGDHGLDSASLDSLLFFALAALLALFLFLRHHLADRGRRPAEEDNVRRQ